MKVYNQIAPEFLGEFAIVGMIGEEFMVVRLGAKFMWYWGPIFLN